jgi:hypothetical protein
MSKCKISRRRKQGGYVYGKSASSTKQKPRARSKSRHAKSRRAKSRRAKSRRAKSRRSRTRSQ